MSPSYIFKLFWWLLVQVPVGIVKEVWNNSPWILLAFAYPLAITAASQWGPISGGYAIAGCLLGVSMIIAARVALRRSFPSPERGIYGEIVDKVYIRRLDVCENSTLAMFVGWAVSLLIVLLATINSPQAKARAARESAEHEATVKSGTLLSETRYGVEGYRYGTVTHNPEAVRNGQLRVVRINIEGDKFSPRMAFLDPSEAPACQIPKAGDKVKVRIQSFRAAMNGSWNAVPGVSGDILVYFVELSCEP